MRLSALAALRRDREQYVRTKNYFYLQYSSELCVYSFYKKDIYVLFF
jgi:hypothetical protein